MELFQCILLSLIGGMDCVAESSIHEVERLKHLRKFFKVAADGDLKDFWSILDGVRPLSRPIRHHMVSLQLSAFNTSLPLFLDHICPSYDTLLFLSAAHASTVFSNFFVFASGAKPPKSGWTKIALITPTIDAAASGGRAACAAGP